MGFREWTRAFDGGVLATAMQDLTDQPVEVAFDNFRLNSGLLECPSWWNETWPDEQPALKKS